MRKSKDQVQLSPSAPSYFTGVKSRNPHTAAALLTESHPPQPYAFEDRNSREQESHGHGHGHG